jgi:hypothetical protein
MDDQAIVLKYLELRASAEDSIVGSLLEDAASAGNLAERFHARGNQLLAKLGQPLVAIAGSDQGRITRNAPTATLEWAQLRQEAFAALLAEGIEPSTVALPRSAHELDVTDVAAALSFGAIGALVPSLGSRRGAVQEAFRQVQRTADSEHLPALVQGVFGRHPAAFMDSGASGMYHRFCDGHDLLTALPLGVAKLGLVRGPIQVFQHLLTDSFGSTGIPLPGTDLIGQAIARVAGVSNITDLISAKDLSRYASFRMSDAVASSATSFLLWAYGLSRGIPEGSMRKPKLGLLAHGLCLVGVAACAATPGLGHLVPFRSHLNYVSLIAMSKHAWTWRSLANSLAAENDATFGRIRAYTHALEEWGTATPSADCIQREFVAAAQSLATSEERI